MFGESPAIQDLIRQYPSSIKAKLCETFEKMRNNLGVAQKRQKGYYDKCVAGQKLEVGDKVFYSIQLLSQAENIN